MRIFQLVPSLHFGDAVGNDIIAIDRVLKKNGYKSYVFALIIDKKMASFGEPFEKMPVVSEDDIIIYHMAVVNPMAEFVKSQRCIRVLRYHNITPPEFFYPYSSAATQACQEGLRQTKALYRDFDYCICDSEFNANDLRSYGYTCPIITIPIVIPFDDYRIDVDQNVYDRFNDGKKNILFVGRFAPNKKWEDVIGSFVLYKKYWNSNCRLIMVGKYDENDLYYQRLTDYIDRIGNEDIVITGHIGFKGILACYKAADLFLCLSEHEGFCVPIVEAMLFHKPIIGYGACAVPETMGTGTMVVHEKNLLQIAALIEYIFSNEDFRKDLIRRQDERLRDFEHDRIAAKFLETINYISKKDLIHKEADV